MCDSLTYLHCFFCCVGSSPPEVFLWKCVLKDMQKFTGVYPCMAGPWRTLSHVRKLKNGNGWLFLCDAWSRYLEKLPFMLPEMHQISNLRSQHVSKEILSDLMRKDVVKFSDKFSHFQYLTMEMFKAALNNYSMLIHAFAMYCKNVSHQYYATNQDTKPHILSYNYPKIGLDQCLSFFICYCFFYYTAFFSFEKYIKRHIIHFLYKINKDVT